MGYNSVADIMSLSSFV